MPALSPPPPTNNQGNSLNNQQVKDILLILPHRFPFLLVDRVENIIQHTSGVGIKAVSICEPWFQGHFPEKPIFPGVLILEAMAQVASIIFGVSNSIDMRKRAIYFVGIDRARFRKPVYPGCILELHVKKIRERITEGNVLWQCKGEAKVEGVLVADGEVMAMMEKSSK